MAHDYLLRVRHADTPPIALIEELRQKLPDLTITLSGDIVWFDGGDTETIRRRVEAALHGLEGIRWQDHFSRL